MTDTLDSVGDDTRQCVVEMRLPHSLDAPYIARRAVGSLIVKGPRLRSVDAALLTGELVTLLLDHEAPIALTLFESGRSIRLEARSEGSATVDPDSITTTLLDRVADRWSTVAGAFWFEIDLLRRRDLSAMSDGDLFSLIRHDRAARDELFERYAPFATALARRFRTAQGTTDDLEQVALLGLVQALERFDLALGVKFTTFSGRWISGTLKRHLRDETWSMRVPRSLKNDVLNLTRTRQDLEQRLGRSPTFEELATELDMTPDQLRDAMLASDVYALTSLNAPAGDDSSGEVGNLIGSEDPEYAVVETWPSIEVALADLNDRDQQILYLRFFEDLTQSEIADIVGVSQVHVSRLLTKSLELLRQRLDGGERGDEEE